MSDIPGIPMKSNVGRGGFETRPYEDVLREVRQQHPEETPEQQEARARYRIEQHVDRRPQKKVTSDQWQVAHLPWWLIAWGIAVLLLLAVIAAKAEPDERLRLIHRAMTVEAEPQQPSGLILQLRNQGTVLTTRPAGLLILNCSTNMSCSMTGSTFNITSAATGATAFSALTASLNTNLGTFSASGNSWDFTAATLFKLRAGASLTTSAAGDLGYDTTAGRWHGFIGAADRLFIGSTNVGVAGQAALSNADGTFTFSDPIVSGPDATGVAATKNPVQIGSLDNSTACAAGTAPCVRSFIMSNAAPTGTEYGLITRNVPSGTQPISAASLPLPTGAAQEHVTAASPHATRLTDGTAFYKATTPADTQPVSAASLPLPAGAATETTLSALNAKINTEITEDYDTGVGTQTMKKFGIALPASGGSVAGGTATNPLRVDPTGTTAQPVSGTVTANAGTGTFTVGQATGTNLHMVCDSGCTPGGSFADSTAFTFGTTAVNNMGAVVDDTATNTVLENSAGAPRMSTNRVLYANPRDAAGNEIASATAAPAGTERGLVTRPIPSGTQTVAGTVTANIGTTGGLALDATVAATQPRTVTGNAASGAADSGNPVKTGGVFNTTQPTVTTGQRVDQQMTARGELLIAKGVSGFSIDNTGFNVTGSLPAGTNNIGGINVAQINGVAPLMGNGLTGTGSPRVTVASDNSNAAGIGGSATGAAVPSAARYIAGAGSGAAGAPNLTGAIFCDNWTNINQIAGAQLITGVASKQTYICNLFLYSATAQNVALVEGTGVVCATGTAGLLGGATAATGQNLAANQGFVLPASTVPWRKTATAADNVCLLQSGTGQVSGVIAWAQF